MEWICYPIFDADDHAYDTSSVVHLRSSPDLTPDAILLRLFRNAHHPDSLSAQLTVVWWLLPEAATGGPSSISIAVTSRPTLLSCHTRSVRALLMHTAPTTNQTHCRILGYGWSTFALGMNSLKTFCIFAHVMQCFWLRFLNAFTHALHISVRNWFKALRLPGTAK